MQLFFTVFSSHFLHENVQQSTVYCSLLNKRRSVLLQLSRGSSIARTGTTAAAPPSFGFNLRKGRRGAHRFQCALIELFLFVAQWQVAAGPGPLLGKPPRFGVVVVRLAFWAFFHVKPPLPPTTTHGTHKSRRFGTRFCSHWRVDFFCTHVAMKPFAWEVR